MLPISDGVGMSFNGVPQLICGLASAAFVLALVNSNEVLASPGSGAPITLINGYPVVEVLINSRGPFRMIVDTGASRCSLSPEAAIEAGISAQHSMVLVTLFGEKTVHAAFAPVLLGSSEPLQSEILIYNVPAVRRVNVHTDGLLGQSFLAQRPYLIDYRARRLWIGAEAIERAGRLSGAVHVELNDDRIVLPVEIEFCNKPFHLVLDSGTTNMVVECKNQCPALAGAQASDLLTNAGRLSVLQGKIRNVRIQTMTLPSLPAALMKRTPNAGETEGLFPARAFSAIYVDAAHKFVRMAR